MTTWILILYIGVGSGGSPTSIRFKTKQGCEEAAQKIKAESGFGVYTLSLCVEDK